VTLSDQFENPHIFPLSVHDALPISGVPGHRPPQVKAERSEPVLGHLAHVFLRVGVGAGRHVEHFDFRRMNGKVELFEVLAFGAHSDTLRSWYSVVKSTAHPLAGFSELSWAARTLVSWLS